MLFDKNKLRLPDSEDALEGRNTPMPVTNRHFVNGREILPPFPAGLERTVFGMGCFWGAEAAFCGLDGVVKTTVGYAGGHVSNPSYTQVSMGNTGHAEVVQVEFDPARISYDRLLEVFWDNHDPTTPNRQGPDVGEQYRSLILFEDQEQEAAARSSMQRHSAGDQRPIVTELAAAKAFYPAELYHQRYLEKLGRARCNPAPGRGH